MRKALSIILCLLLALSLFAGCAGTDGEETDNAPSPSDGGVEAAGGDGGTDGGAGETLPPPDKNAFPADTALFSLGGESVTWEDYYPWLLFSVRSVMSVYGDTMTDYFMELDEDLTLADYFKSTAADAMRYYTGIERNTAELGVALSEDELAVVEQSMDDSRATFETDEEYIAQVTSTYGSEDMYRYMLEMEALCQVCFADQFGENGEKLTEDEVLEYTAGDGYMMAKHILLLTADDDGNEYSDEEKAELYARMEGCLAELDACGDSESLEAKFDELMRANSDDTGMEMFPKGYLFQSGDMVSEFEEATLALGEYEYSGIVESSYGYHIILRLPIDVDSIPMAYSSYLLYGMSYTLRFLTAQDMFSEVTANWAEDLTFETEAAYESMDLTKVFPAA